MAISKFVCVFLAFNANAPAEAPDEYLALMESTKPGINFQGEWQSLVNEYVDQNGHITAPLPNQFITSEEELQMRIQAGENVLASGRTDFPYSSREEFEAQLEERQKALEEIKRANNGQNAEVCMLLVM